MYAYNQPLKPVRVQPKTVIDIYHDTACPWCWIGITNLYDAIRQIRDIDVEDRWHPFFLAEEIPADGLEYYSFMQELKGLDANSLKTLFDTVAEQGKLAGLNIRFDKITLAVNTTLSHRAIAIVPPSHKKEMAEAIYRAYFQLGANIGDIKILRGLGESIGLDRELIYQGLTSNASLTEVTAASAKAKQQNIPSVPHFVINNSITVNGSASVPVFLEALNRARSSDRALI